MESIVRLAMSKKYNVAVVGATGEVGKTLIRILEQRRFPVENLYLLASERSAGKTIAFNKKSISVQNLADFDFSQVEIGLFSAGGSVSAEYAPKAGAAGCIVIDNTSHFRYEEDIPLVIPEVNPHAIANYKNQNIIANPNCSTMQMLVALKPIQDRVGISRINVATYQSVSGTGKEAIDELAGQTSKLLNGLQVEIKVYPRQIAFNAVPQIDSFMDNGYTREEMKMVWETQKIFEDDSILVNATCVRVPVFYGHSEAVHIETRETISVEEVRDLLRSAPGVKLLDRREDGGYPTAISEGTDDDSVWVGRIRKDISHPTGMNMWIVSDNLRKGAALNSVQIAEVLIKDYL